MTSDKQLHWILRVGAAACFIGHGAFGVLTKPQWLPFFGLVGIGADTAYRLMPIIGAVDIAVGISVLLSPRPAVLLYMTGWALWTAALRPLTGDHLSEMLERAGNYGVPLALLASAVRSNGWRRWLAPLVSAPITPRLHARLSYILVWTTAILLAGHGMLGVMQKRTLVEHYALVTAPTVGPTLAIVIGVLEVLMSLAFVIWPLAKVAVVIVAWKLVSESLFIASGAPVWEFVERAGSYAAPLAVMILAGMAMITVIPAADWMRRLVRLKPRGSNVSVLLAIALSATATAGAQVVSDDSLLSRLRAGGLAVACRHAITSHEREDQTPINFADRSTQRNLSAAGEDQARVLGENIRAARIPVGDVYANPLFRTLETATIAFGKVTVIDSLGDSGVLRRLLQQRVPAQQNNFFSTRNGMLMNAFRGTEVTSFNEGDCVVVEPTGDAYSVVRKLAPNDWARLAGRTP